MSSKYNTMKLSTFLAHYLGINNENLSKLTHKDIEKIFPFKKTTFEVIDKNKELLLLGKVIVVRDSKGKDIPYIIPDTIYISSDYGEILINYNRKINYDIKCTQNNDDVYTSTNINNEEVNIKVYEKREEVLISKEDIINNIDVLSDWELRKLLIIYKKYYSIYNIIKKELIIRGVKNKKSKKYKNMKEESKKLIKEYREEY